MHAWKLAVDTSSVLPNCVFDLLFSLHTIISLSITVSTSSRPYSHWLTNCLLCCSNDVRMTVFFGSTNMLTVSFCHHFVDIRINDVFTEKITLSQLETMTFFGGVTWILMGNKCAKFRFKIWSGCSENGKKTLGDSLFCHTLYMSVDECCWCFSPDLLHFCGSIMARTETLYRLCYWGAG